MADKKSVVLFGPLPPPFGGVSIFMSAMLDAVIERGVCVWAYSGAQNYKREKNPRFVNHRRLDHIRLLFRQGRNARIIDSTHFHLEYPNPVLLPAWLLAKLLIGFQWVKIMHDGSLPARHRDFGLLPRILFNWSLKSIDEIIVPSAKLELWLRNNAGHKGAISVIPTLLPTPDYGSVQSNNAELPEILRRFKSHKKRVCSIGFSIPTYGFHHVAEAIEKVRSETGHDVGLLLIDGGMEADHSYRAEMFKGRDWIEIIEGVPHPSIKKVFEESDVFVRANECEGFGISRIEAIWSGIPVIATNEGETRGMLLFKYGDTAMLANHLKSVLRADVRLDTGRWAEIYSREASENLKNYLHLITGQHN